MELRGVDDFPADANSIGIRNLSDSRRILRSLGGLTSPIDDLHTLTVLNVGRAYRRFVPRHFLRIYGRGNFVGHYVESEWFLKI